MNNNYSHITIIYLSLARNRFAFCRIWQSLAAVRNSHSSVSLRMNKHRLGGITQKDMALVQLGFFSIILTNGPRIGIHDAEREDLEGLIHLWRVIGYAMGIEERYFQKSLFFSVFVIKSLHYTSKFLNQCIIIFY